MRETLARKAFEAVNALTQLADSIMRRFKMLLNEYLIEMSCDDLVKMFVAPAKTVTVRNQL
jgi:hypothetical protein